jgi:hypothetical protein
MDENTDSGDALWERAQDLDLVARALRRAVREALRQHKQAGNPIAAWRDGRVVWIEPEDIVLPPE